MGVGGIVDSSGQEDETREVSGFGFSRLKKEREEEEVSGEGARAVCMIA